MCSVLPQSLTLVDSPDIVDIVNNVPVVLKDTDKFL